MKKYRERCGSRLRQLGRVWNLNRNYVLLGLIPFLSETVAKHTSESIFQGSLKKNGNRPQRNLFSRMLLGKDALSCRQTPDAIVLPAHGRFGHNFRQLVQALAAADHFNIVEVISQRLLSLPFCPIPK